METLSRGKSSARIERPGDSVASRDFQVQRFDASCLCLRLDRLERLAIGEQEPGLVLPRLAVPEVVADRTVVDLEGDDRERFTSEVMVAFASTGAIYNAIDELD